jgi:hypothetical protein
LARAGQKRLLVQDTAGTHGRREKFAIIFRGRPCCEIVFHELRWFFTDFPSGIANFEYGIVFS